MVLYTYGVLKYRFAPTAWMDEAVALLVVVPALDATHSASRFLKQLRALSFDYSNEPLT